MRIPTARPCWLILALAFVNPSGLPAADETVDDSPSPDNVQALADRIDFHISRAWTEHGVTPAPRADDAEYLRRVWLDIGGKVPPAYEVRRFLQNDDPNKRRAVVDRLLESPGYIMHFTTFWRNVMLPEVKADFQARRLVPAFDAWMRERLADNTRYDELARAILTVELQGSPNPYRRAGGLSPIAFYQAKQIAPENLAAATSRIFLGIRIECAQCHDHPFDTWQREQFWSFAAFFGGIQRQGNRGVFGRVRELFGRHELAIPDTGKVVQAAFLDGTRPQWRFRLGPRETLARWMTSPENPYFARTAVNRLWGYLFGTGIVDPVDDFGVNRPSHPELLKELSRRFVAEDFDLKFLIRAMCASRTYQLTSRQTDESQSDPRLFARMAVRGLSPEQIFDSLAQATGSYHPYEDRNPFAFRRNSSRSEFLELFNNDNDVPTERQTTILQALAMMNGGLISRATDLEQSRTLAAVADFPTSDAERIEALYFAALSRPPRPQELRRLIGYVESGGQEGSRQRALADVFWALLNSSEFLFNH